MIRLDILIISIAISLYSQFSLAELTLQLDKQGLTESQLLASEQLLKEAKEVLPPYFIKKLDRIIIIKWANLSPIDAYGQTNGSFGLNLNKKLLTSLTDGTAATKKTNRVHGTVRQELLATIVHELTHLYDDAGFFSQIQQPHIQYCKRLVKAQGLMTLPLYCAGFIKRHFSLSDDANFLDLAGWPLLVGENGLRDDHNDHVDRTPDRYELTNPQEFLAVNMEYFLLDQNYACRRPRLNSWFSHYFDWHPVRQRKCNKDYVYLFANDDPKGSPLEHLDPERIYGVDYLFATANKKWMSRWGHSMLRLIICAPERPRGPDCRLDLEYHRVLSYRAFINDLQLSSIKGLTGSYPSRLFILPLNQVVDEYTKLEWRPLESVPLNLTRAQLLSLVDQAIELHWSYDGNYYFISNNCAVETLKLLRASIDRSDLQTLDTITPSGLLKLLEIRGLADTSVLNNRPEAMKKGYYFDSYRERYELMFKIIKQQLILSDKTVDDWLQRPASNRSHYFKTANLRTTAALILLEQAAGRRQTLLVIQLLKQRYLNVTNGNDKNSLATQDDIQKMIAHSAFLSRPSGLLQEGYGLPLPEEISALTQKSLEQQQVLSNLMTNLKEQLKTVLPRDLLTELEGTEANIKILSEQLKELHKASGGLDLHKLHD